MSVHDGRGIKPLPEKEISVEHRYQIRAGIVGQSERQIRRAREKTGRRRQGEGRSYRESHKGPAATAVVTGGGVCEWEVGLPILRQR
jgi:hypothetical protein